MAQAHPSHRDITPLTNSTTVRSNSIAFAAVHYLRNIQGFCRQEGTGNTQRQGADAAGREEQAESRSNTGGIVAKSLAVVLCRNFSCAW